MLNSPIKSTQGSKLIEILIMVKIAFYMLSSVAVLITIVVKLNS